MQQLLSVWSALDPRRRVIVVIASVAMFVAVLALTRMAGSPRMALLYSGLQGTAAGEIVKALDQQGVAYEVRGDSVWVDAGRRDALRMTLAAEGLPGNGGAGYELLDNLSGFGTTARMFDAAYWRATEGELARSIVTNPQIRAARVYISAGQSQPFRRENKPTASVMVTTVNGALSTTQARALKFLVASAVSGLRPEDVSVIDSVAGLVVDGDGGAAGLDGGGRAAQLKRNVQGLLDARVGPGKSVVAVHVDTINERESILEKRFDPNGRVAISTVTQETSGSSSDKGDAGVSVASNLPTGDAGGAGSSASSQRSENRSQTNYEVSSTQRQVERGPGAIRRLSVAVMVDGVRSAGADGKTEWKARPDAELKALRDLVASAVGYDEKRGDTITIRSLAFETGAVAGTAASTSPLAGLGIDPMQVLQILVLAVVAVVLGLLVIRPILLPARREPGGGAAQLVDGRAAGAAVALPGQAGAAGAIAPPAVGTPDAAIGTIAGAGPDAPATLAATEDPGGTEDRPERSAQPAGGGDEPVARLRRLIEARQDETLAILQSWVEDEKETTS